MDTEIAFVCLDLETTGLDVDNCCILEIGIVAANKACEPVQSWSRVVMPTTEMSEMDDFVRDMHRGNGLLEDVDNLYRFMDPEWDRHDALAEYGPWAAASAAIEVLLSWGVEAETLPLFGSSILFDRRFMFQHMPHLEQFFHYRNIDISTVKELVKVWQPEVKWKPKGSKGHRVISDCEATLDEAKFYLDRFFSA